MSADEVVGTVEQIHRFPVKSMLGERLEAAEIGERGLFGDRAWAVVDRGDGTVASAKRPRRWARLLELRAVYVEPPSAGAPLPPVRIDLPDGTVVRTDTPGADGILGRFIGREVALTDDAPTRRRFHEVWPAIEGLAPAEFIEGTTVGDDDGDPVSEIDLAAAAPGTFFDVAPLHLLTTGTLDALAAHDPAATFDVRRYRPNLLVRSGAAGFVENAWPGRTVAVGAEVRATGLLATMRCVMTTLAQDGLPPDRATLRAVAAANRVEIPGLGTWACAGVYAGVAAGGTVRLGDEVVLVGG